MGFVRQITGKDAADQAKKAQRSSDALGQEQLQLSREQFDWQKGLSQEQFDWQKGVAQEQRDYERGIVANDRATAEQDYLRRLGIVDELVASADFTPEFYDKQVGAATAGVRSSLDKSRESGLRELSRNGVNPSSGAYQAMSDKFALTGAALEANAANTTRMGLATEERSRQDAARHAGLDVAPQFITTQASNPTVGLENPALGIKNPTIGTLGNLSSEKASQAAGWTANSAASRAALIQAGVMATGAAAG